MTRIPRLFRFAHRMRINLRSSRLLRWGTSLTAIWFAIVVAYLVAIADVTSLRQPGNFGDFFSGIFAPVAFLWLVITALMQARELALQRRELQQNRHILQLQAEELKNSVQQFSAQTAIFREQSAMQMATELERSCYEKIGNIGRRLVEISHRITFDHGPENMSGINYAFSDRDAFRELLNGGHVDEFYSRLPRRLERFKMDMLGMPHAAPRTTDFPFSELEQICSSIEEVKKAAIDHRLGGVADKAEAIGLAHLAESIRSVISVASQLPVRG